MSDKITARTKRICALRGFLASCSSAKASACLLRPAAISFLTSSRGVASFRSIEMSPMGGGGTGCAYAAPPTPSAIAKTRKSETLFDIASGLRSDAWVHACSLHCARFYSRQLSADGATVPLEIYNTLSRSKQPLQPIVPGRVGL